MTLLAWLGQTQTSEKSLLCPVTQPGLEFGEREERHGTEARVTEAEGECWCRMGGMQASGCGLCLPQLCLILSCPQELGGEEPEPSLKEGPSGLVMEGHLFKRASNAFKTWSR